jgi:hypothetical protein
MRAQNGECHLVIVQVTVVEADQHARAARPVFDGAFDKGQGLLQADHRNVPLQVRYLFAQLLGSGRKEGRVESIVAGIADAVIGEDQQQIALRQAAKQERNAAPAKASCQ